VSFKGYGAVQRAVLARLAKNTADPLGDFEVPPGYQSWTPLGELARAAGCHRESARRALGKLDGAVETRLLYPVQWIHLSRAVRGGLPPDAQPPVPGARRHDYRAVAGPHKGEPMTYWEYPRRDYGNAQLHARLALTEEHAQRYAEAEEHWRRVGRREWLRALREYREAQSLHQS
jgi:hypothetical protein